MAVAEQIHTLYHLNAAALIFCDKIYGKISDGKEGDSHSYDRPFCERRCIPDGCGIFNDYAAAFWNCDVHTEQAPLNPGENNCYLYTVRDFAGSFGSREPIALGTVTDFLFTTAP